MKLIIAFPAAGKTELSQVVPGCVDLDFGFYRSAHDVEKSEEATLFPSFCKLITAYIEQGHTVLTNEPKLLDSLPLELRSQTVVVVPRDPSFAVRKLQQTPDIVEQLIQDWISLAHDANVPVIQLDTSLLTALLDHVLDGQDPISVPPKPAKNQVPESQYLDVLRDHHHAVQSLLARGAVILMEHGAKHDLDKIANWESGVEQPAVPHRRQAHHWYASENQILPDLFDIIESCADTVATTAGKQSLDPWVQEWTPPLQDSQWWEDVILRTCNRFNDMLDYPMLNARMPRDVPTNRIRD